MGKTSFIGYQLMSEKISPGLDPASYLGLSAGLASSVGDPAVLLAQSDILLAQAQSGDYSVMIRHHNALALASQMAAHSALHKAMQCDSPEEHAKWIATATKAQAIANNATSQVILLTNTEEKLKPYRQQIQNDANQKAALALNNAKALAIAKQMFVEHKAQFETEILRSNMSPEEYLSLQWENE